ncbi:COG3650 family protein [Qipengyuania zhejiangensis]|uniref:COG3650 family protein n=1 Tax=Qipengyuania zhejiangensis TaxID=3077782 RepID=UPI002D77D94E|nr:hypothetical protein [Qipengyuania sp. Z2]
MRGRFAGLACAVALAACQPGGDGASTGATEAFSGIAKDETVRITGTEPFWAGEIAGTMARYSTPENPDGSRFSVERFAGLNGVSFSGQLGEARFDLMITPGECSDGMSDRTYPFTATLMLGSEQRLGCAWTDRQPYTGSETP